jgi:hypothetical protein
VGRPIRVSRFKSKTDTHEVREQRIRASCDMGKIKIIIIVVIAIIVVAALATLVIPNFLHDVWASSKILANLILGSILNAKMKSTDREKARQSPFFSSFFRLK